MDNPSYIREPEHFKPIDILLVEDDLGDILLTKLAFREAGFQNKLIVVGDGQQALDYIYHRGVYTDIEKYPRPDLILLDINMPKINGFEVLKIIKSDNDSKSIPVIMLTSSRSENDIAKCYQDGATSYISKPLDYKDFVETVKLFNFYWGETNRLPSKKTKISVSPHDEKSEQSKKFK